MSLTLHRRIGARSDGTRSRPRPSCARRVVALRVPWPKMPHGLRRRRLHLRMARGWPLGVAGFRVAVEE